MTHIEVVSVKNLSEASHIASKLTIVSKFYQIVRVEKCALNTDSTIPTQSIILSDHVVGKMFI